MHTTPCAQTARSVFLRLAGSSQAGPWGGVIRERGRVRLNGEIGRDSRLAAQLSGLRGAIGVPICDLNCGDADACKQESICRLLHRAQKDSTRTGP